MPLSSPSLSFLSGSIRNLNNGRGNPLCIFPSSSVKAFGFPIKDLGNDGKGRSSPLNGSIRGPQYFKPKKKAKTWIPD